MPVSSWRSGAIITTQSGTIPCLETKHQHKRAGRFTYIRAPRQWRLNNLKTRIINPTDSHYKWGTNGEQVTMYAIEPGFFHISILKMKTFAMQVQPESRQVMDSLSKITSNFASM